MSQGFIEIISIALIYCGTVFGAGFASGQEIVGFFSSHQRWGVAVSVFVGFLFSWFGYAVCTKAKEYKRNSAKEYFGLLFPETVSKILNFICMSFLVVSFCIMITGAGTLFQEQFSIKPVFGALFSLVICYKIMKNAVYGLRWFNAVITPFMFLGVVALGCAALAQADTNAAVLESGNPQRAAFSGILYFSYNMVSAAAVLASCASLAETKRRAGLGGALGGIFIAIPLVLLSLVLTLFPEYQGEQLPFFALICAIQPKLKPFCGVLLYSAMLTTAASSGVSVLAQTKPRFTGKYAAILCAAAFAASFVPFNVLVKTMYTAFGVCGLLLILGILKSIIRKR